MSDSFRDLERPDGASRKQAVLMAAISALECLERPSKQDLAWFSRLFMPLYAAANPDVRRTVSATLSRLGEVPDDVAEVLINEPIAIAAPFIAQYPKLKENMLARAVARRGAPHARAAARRSDLSPEAIEALRGLNDPSVEGLLILRGLIPDPAAVASPAPAGTIHLATPPTRQQVTAPPLDPSEKLRAELKALVVRTPTENRQAETPASVPAAQRPGRRAEPVALNRPTSSRKTALSGDDVAKAVPAPDAAQKRVRKARLAQLARFARPDQESWFATALADAMETSFALAERIMMDVSGRQLATAMIGLGAAEDTIRASLESFFPHLAEPSANHTLATDLIGELDAESCAARLDAWRRADSYTHGGASHAPALADSKPVRKGPFERSVTPRGTRVAASPRKAG